MRRRQAYVASMEKLEEFKAKLGSYCQLCRMTAELALLECRKVEEMLQEELSYWRQRLKQLQDDLALAKAELNRIRVATPRGQTPRDGDALLLVRRITRRIEQAEDATRALRAMSSAAAEAREHLRKELMDLLERTEGNPAEPVARLDAILQRLTQYLTVRLPQPTDGDQAGNAEQCPP